MTSIEVTIVCRFKYEVTIFMSILLVKIIMQERKDLSQHILPTSAQLVGVCMTVISLVRVLHIGQAG
jgi:hypothetical protein